MYDYLHDYDDQTNIANHYIRVDWWWRTTLMVADSRGFREENYWRYGRKLTARLVDLRLNDYTEI